MGEELRIISLSLIFLLAVSPFVYAVGSSTQTQKDTAKTYPVVTECNSLENLRERIKCRLQDRNSYQEYAGEDESCSGLPNQQACLALYKASEECYEKSHAVSRIGCFRVKTGIVMPVDVGVAPLTAEEARKSALEARRNYMVLLLYELQERAEEASESGRITDDEAAEIIARIVETKQAILSGAKREEIKSSIMELKTLWRNALNE